MTKLFFGSKSSIKWTARPRRNSPRRGVGWPCGSNKCCHRLSIGVRSLSVGILGGAVGRGMDRSCGMSTGALRSYRGVGVSPEPSKSGSCDRMSGEALPWLDRSVCLGDGGVYTFREGIDVMEMGDCGGNGCCGGATGCCAVTPIPSLISSNTDFFTSAVICAISSGSTLPAESDLSNALLRALWRGCW